MDVISLRLVARVVWFDHRQPCARLSMLESNRSNH